MVVYSYNEYYSTIKRRDEQIHATACPVTKGYILSNFIYIKYSE
jgi:hypothetical protein